MIFLGDVVNVVATTRPMSNSSTSSKSQRRISSRNISCIFTRELDREPQQYSTDYLYKVSWSVLQLCIVLP